MQATCLKNLVVSRLDDFSIIISKKMNGQCHELSEQEEAKIKEIFEYVAPWHNDYCLQFNCRFEILGIPLQY